MYKIMENRGRQEDNIIGKLQTLFCKKFLFFENI